MQNILFKLKNKIIILDCYLGLFILHQLENLLAFIKSFCGYLKGLFFVVFKSANPKLKFFSSLFFEPCTKGSGVLFLHFLCED